MPTTALPSAEDLRKLLTYDAETGKLFWKERPDARPQLNARIAGKEAFTTKKKNGYLSGAIFGKKQYAHRVAMCMITGRWPDQDVDHINGDRADNRALNLRSVSRSDNMKNAAKSKTASTKNVGVFWDRGAYKAYINSDRKRINLGRFKSLEDAISARKAAEIEHGFHPNHGR